jgi:signal transduction histidine kinase
MDRKADYAQYARILMDVAAQFGATLDLDRLLPLVLDRMTELLQAERALFALFDTLGRVERAVVRNLEWAGPGHPLPVSSSLIDEVRSTERAVVVADAQSDVQFQSRQSVQILGLRFMVGVPVHVDGRVGGVLYVDSRAGAGVVRDLKDDLELLGGLARLVGTAVENARLFEEQRYRTHLLAQLVHDFRTPLSIISANAEMLTLQEGADPDEQLEMAGDIAASAQRMSRMVDNTLELARIDVGAASPQPELVDLGAAVPRHLRALEMVARRFGVELVARIPDGLPHVHTVPDRLWIILDNLLFNALKHAREGTTITLSLEQRDDAGPPDALARPADEASLFRRLAPLVPRPASKFVEVTVHNQGEPIPPPLMARIFEAYVRGGDAQAGFRSTGLGLAIVDQCARYLGGTVWVRSSARAGTAFSFTLPTSIHAGPVARTFDGREHHDTIPMSVMSLGARRA